ncbi:MAG: hypothetical protein K6G47_07310 [Clostridia bacterium]|nr:hypothetical protein [Clostridia bacterium]
MKRDYSNDNIISTKDYLQKAYDHTDQDYRDPYYYQSVPDKHRNLKYDSLCTGSDANQHIKSIRDRIHTTLTVMSKFYTEVDSTSLQVYGMANHILLILKEVNTSMDKINMILSGLENYSGKTVTPAAIQAAGISKKKINSIKRDYYKFIFPDSDSVTKFVDEMKSKGELSPEDISKLKAVYDLYLNSGDELSGEDLRRFVDVFELLGSSDLTEDMLNDFMNNDEAVKLYLDDVKALNVNGGALPSEEMDKLKRFHYWYVKNRFDSKGDENVDIMDEQRLKNSIDTYEILNPDAKKITDNFFKDVYGKNDKNVDLNVLRIKYSIYTCSPMYRDLILGYLPNMTLNPLDPGKGASCSPKKIWGQKFAVLNLDLHQTTSGNCCSFFHEFGHGLDHLSGPPDGDTSEAFNVSLRTDAQNRVYKDLDDYNNSVPDSEKLDTAEKDRIVEYVFDRDKNPNVVNNSNDKPDLPKDWSDKQIKAYEYLRDVYGYPKYVYSDQNRRSDVYPQRGWYHGASRDGIVDDIFGGMTNSKLCGKGHAYDVNKDTYTNYKDFQTKVIKNSYYYSGTMTDTEFYAEVFEYSALNRDLNTTKEVFGTTLGDYKNAINKAYDALK